MRARQGSVPVASETKARRGILGYIDVLFSGGLSDFVAWGVVVAILSIELFMNLQNGEGWISTTHLAVIGPLWLTTIAFIVIAAIRAPWRDSRNVKTTSDTQ